METPHALVKDLRSTGYFFNELKSYSQSSEIDVETYCTGFAVPYLLRVSESYDKSGRSPRSGILMLAIKHLSDPSECEIVDSIFGIKKVAESEIKGLSVSKTFVLASDFWPALAAPQSQNPRLRLRFGSIVATKSAPRRAGARPLTGLFTDKP